MRTLSIKLSTLASTGTMLLAVSAAFAADNLPLMAPTPGAKIDSGLGDLPHYRYWADPTGKAPVAPTVVAAGTAPR